MKHHSQTQLGREGFILLTVPYNSSSSKAVTARPTQVRNLRQELMQRPWRQELMQRPWRQELMQRPWRVLLTGFLSLLSYNTQGHEPREGTTHNDLGPFPQSQIRKMSDRLAYSPSYVGSFSTAAPSSLMTLACVRLT
jgi:hypothetical protein